MSARNTKRIPRNRSLEFAAGWRACEAGGQRGDNPYWRAGTELQAVDWNAGFELRAEAGFDVAHLPRTLAGAFR